MSTSEHEYVFVNPQTGKPWNDIRKMFKRAKNEAGMPDIWFHDCRRSFYTNARRRGIPETVVMKLSGHRTRSVFERYNVIAEKDLQDAIQTFELGSSAEQEKSDRFGEKTG